MSQTENNSTNLGREPATPAADELETPTQRTEEPSVPARKPRQPRSRSRSRTGRGAAATKAGKKARPAAPEEESIQPAPEEKTPPAAEPAAAAKPAAAEAKPEAGKKGRGRHKRGAGKKAEEAQVPKEEEESSSPATGPVRKLFINAEEPEECRIALVEDGKLQAFHVKTLARERTKGNIYKGRVTAIEPSLQAAFVDLGMTKNGFLPFGEIHPEYYKVEVDPDTHWKDLKIQDVMRKGQEVLVQVVKEVTELKGANVTTYLSLPGRYLVLMPGSDSAGISRKIEDESQRNQLREMMSSLELPEGIGYILRTASQEITKTALSKDLKFLLRLWDEIKTRGQSMTSPALVYQDQDIISRFLRDHFTNDIDEILGDNKEVYDQVVKFLKLFGTKSKVKVRLHKGTKPIFNQYNLEDQIEQIYQPTISLPSGGSIVINPTEALVAIDVNSGRTSKDKDFEQTIFLANMEAAAELTRQLRLRDLGGLIVVDFIDMRDSRHIREVEKQVKNCMKGDRAKVSLSRISKFGLMQISRQKLGPPIQLGSYKVCDHCQGRGLIRSVETLSLFYLRKIQTGVTQKKVEKVTCTFPMEVAQYLLNNKRKELLEMEQQYRVVIVILPDHTMNPADHHIEFAKRSA